MRIFAGSVLVAFGMMIAGCSSGSSSKPNPPTPPTPPSPSVAVSAPQDGTTVYGMPVKVSIATANLSDASMLSVRLNGTDITSKLSAPDSSGVRTAQLSPPDIGYGKNQIQARYQDVVTNSSFTLNTTSAQDSSPTPSYPVPSSTLLVGITTRVLQQSANGPTWSIELTTSAGTVKTLSAPLPVNEKLQSCTDCSAGFQIVVLSRQDLSQVSNMSYETVNPQELAVGSPFMNALSALGYGPSDSNVKGVAIPPQQLVQNYKKCQPFGCIVVVQSLTKIGDMPCYYSGDTTRQGKCQWAADSQSSNNAFNLAYWLTKLGASGNLLFANGGNKNVGYSFIGNAGTGQLPGTGVQNATPLSNGFTPIAAGGNQNSQYERLGCLDTIYENHSPIICDNLGRAGSSYNSGGSSDPQQAGRISGVLIRDNYDLFTFSQSMRQIAYTFGTTVSAGGSPLKGGTYTNVVSIDGQGPNSSYGYYPKTITLDPGQGGFRLLVLDRSHPDWDPNVTIRIDKFYKCCGVDNELQQLSNDISSNNVSNNIFFLAAIGFIQHNIDTSFATAWEQQFVQPVQLLGGDPITARILGDLHNPFNPTTNDPNILPNDDYLLVGKITAYSPPFGEQFTSGTQARFTAQESGYVINRHTIANAPYPTQVEGVLVPDHQGYYTPHLQSLKSGFLAPQVASLASASLQLPTAWPYSSIDFNATKGEKLAYTWISGKICGCSDIRSNYPNLNASPTSWVAQMGQLTYPTDQSSNFSATEFSTVQQHLALEFGYVADARSLLANILSLYESQQSNIGLILTQAQDDINSQLHLITPPPPSHSPWSILTSDVFPVLANLSSLASSALVGPEAGIAMQLANPAFENALGIGSLVIDNATDHTNDATGVSQQMQALSNEDIAAASLAEHETNQYIDSLATLGNDFKRVVTNWNGLQAIGTPIESGQLSWDPLATSFYLRAFDLATRRQFYPQLINGSQQYFASHIKYADWQYNGSNSDYHDSHGNDCKIDQFHAAWDNLSNPGIYVDSSGQHDLTTTAWWPGALQSPGQAGNQPGSYWWDIWAFQELNSNTHECPDSESYRPTTFKMFDPVNLNDPTNSGLGLWKPYVLQYIITPLHVHKNQNYDNLP